MTVLEVVLIIILYGAMMIILWRPFNKLRNRNWLLFFEFMILLWPLELITLMISVVIEGVIYIRDNEWGDRD